ncbi:cupin, partial [Streptomyces sp. YS-3]
FQASPPPDHERYFEELLELLADGGGVDPAAVEELRVRYDIEQLTPLRHSPAVQAPTAGAGVTS